MAAMKDDIKISVITVCYNSEKTIEKTIRSVSKQNYENKEHIIIDGKSSDGTLEIIRRVSGDLKYISEKDTGVYNAMNKGLKLATGDLIVFLNSDDWFVHEGILRAMCEPFFHNEKLDIGLFAVSMVKPANNETFRKVRSIGFKPGMLLLGLMPPHPGMVVKNNVFRAVGVFQDGYKIAGDYEWCLRAFLKHKVRYATFSEEAVRMQLGGLSTRGIKSYFTVTKESAIALWHNGFALSLPFVMFRVIFKLKQFWS